MRYGHQRQAGVSFCRRAIAAGRSLAICRDCLLFFSFFAFGSALFFFGFSPRSTTRTFEMWMGPSRSAIFPCGLSCDLRRCRLMMRTPSIKTRCLRGNTSRIFPVVKSILAPTFSFPHCPFNPYSSDITTLQAITSNVLSSGGVFTSFPAGLSINTITGEIIPSMSTPGTYTVNYDIVASTSCPAGTRPREAG